MLEFLGNLSIMKAEYFLLLLYYINTPVTGYPAFNQSWIFWLDKRSNTKNIKIETKSIFKKKWIINRVQSDTVPIYILYSADVPNMYCTSGPGGDGNTKIIPLVI